MKCLVDGLSLTYCPSGDLSEVFAVMLSLAITDTVLLSSVIALIVDRLESPSSLFTELYSLSSSSH